MRTVIVDKIASVAQTCGLTREVRVSAEMPCEEGVVVVAEVLNNKSRYNTLELVSGRMAQIKRGDVIVGALGHRKALFGYSGHLPEQLAPGDIIQLLNIGGVLGVCDSINPENGPPFDCRMIGTALQFPYLGERIGVPARIGGAPRLADGPLDIGGVPIVAVAGSCMQAGKTAAACAIVSRLRHNGFTVDAFKATGVSLRRDVLAMEDAGARRTMIFTDLGVVTTTAANGPALTRAMLNALAKERPDAIVFELGDGLIGAYGVAAILASEDIRACLSALVLSASDPVAAWGGVRILREQHRIEPCAITGPATDNQVGIDLIRDQLGLPGHNALTDGAGLAECVQRAIGLAPAPA